MKNTAIGIFITATLLAVNSFANASLTGADLDAANAYFSAHPDIDKYAPWIRNDVMSANTLKDANYKLVSNSYYDQVQGKVIYVSQIGNIVIPPATTVTLNPTFPSVAVNANKPVIVPPTVPQNEPGLLAVISPPVAVSTVTVAKSNTVLNVGYTKNDPTGQPVDVRALAQAALTTSKYAAANAPRDGIDGKNGADGHDGAKGDKGDTGAQGLQGIQGVAGANGKDGADGHDGAKGDKGDTGAQGLQGIQGVAGTNGKDGADGHDGVTRVQVDTKTQKQVVNNGQKILSNSLNITANTQGVTNNTNSISSTNQRVNNNTTQLSRQNDDLHSLHSEIQNMNRENNTQFNALKNEVEHNEKQANAGISGAMAMAAIPQVQTNQHVMFGAGAGEYNGESALAVGASVNFNDHVVGKVNMSADTADNYGIGVGVGVGF